MNLRRRFVFYLVAIHLLFALLALLFLIEKEVAAPSGDRSWLFGAEAVFALFALSLVAGLALVRNLFGTLGLIQEAAQFLKESDFTSRLRDVGQPEMDQLVSVYNRMVDHLREERTRLQEQQYLLGNILNVSPSGIVILDFDGRVDSLNPAAERLLHETADRLRGGKPSEMASPLGQAIAGLAAGESRVIAVHGGRRIRCRRGAFLDRGFARSFVLMEELTDELRQVEKAAYEKLIRMMSHEVNNTVGASNSLLNSCLNYAPLIAPEHRPDFEEALRVVIARTEQLSAFMRSFADVVRLPPPRPIPQDVHALVRRIALLLRPECERRRVAWNWDVQEPIGDVPMDRMQMEQVFVNVFKNALEAVGEDGAITVRLGRRGARGMVVVEDTGPGIPPDARAHVFTPFFSTKQNGQGIGLTLVQEILSQHRFEYSLEAPPGGPTQFTIVF